MHYRLPSYYISGGCARHYIIISTREVMTMECLCFVLKILTGLVMLKALKKILRNRWHGRDWMLTRDPSIRASLVLTDKVSEKRGTNNTLCSWLIRGRLIMLLTPPKSWMICVTG